MAAPEDAQNAAEYFYSRGRRPAALRQLGLLVFAVLPVVLYQSESAGPYLAAGAALWAVAELVAVRPIERRMTARGAACQELFDTELLSLPWNAALVDRLPVESVTHAASHSKHTVSDALGWYDASPTTAPAKQACQAENARWSIAIQRTFILVLTALTIVAATVGIVLALADGLTLENYLSRIAVPSVPALMSVVALIQRHREALADWVRAERVMGEHADPSIDRLREQQDLLYLARASYPLVPRLLYQLKRPGLHHG